MTLLDGTYYILSRRMFDMTNFRDWTDKFYAFSKTGEKLSEIDISQVFTSYHYLHCQNDTLVARRIMLMNDTNTWTIKGILIGMIALIYFITYLILRNSTRLVSILGKTVNNVIMRLMGLILMVIAVKCFVSELKPILIDIIQSSRM